MRDFSYACYCLAASGLFSVTSVQAQYILAGQATGAVYTDLVPDKKISVFLTGPTSQQDSLDLDGDGRFDLRLTASIHAGSGTPGTSGPYSYAGLESALQVLHNNAAVAEYQYGAYVWRCASQDTIQQRLPPPSGLSQPLAWLDKTIGPYYGYARLTYLTYSPLGTVGYGPWNNATEGYVAIRLRASSSQQWRYGWIRIQVTPVATLNSPAFKEVTVTIKDYAFTTSVLSQHSAIAAGWQLTPNPTADWLTVTAPAAKGYLVLEDICGRPCLTTSFADRQRLDLSPLATGVYMLRIHTAAGSFVQRIIKQ